MNVTLNCNHCHKNFEVPYKQRNKKFCNQTCYLDFCRLNNSLGRKKDESIREKRNCVECDSEFIVKKNLPNKLCSDACRIKWASKSENKKLRIENSKKAIFEKYGVTSLLTLEHFRKKMKDSFKSKYGVDHPMVLDEFVEKLKNTVRNSHLEKLLPKLKSSNITLLDEYKTNKIDNTSLSYNFKCDICDNIFSSTLLGVGRIPLCRKCNPINKNSSLEIKIRDFLNENKIKHIDGDKKILNGKEIDIFLPDYNIGIEINGCYYHSEINGGKDQKYHLNKSILSKQKNIKLIHIFEDEINQKKDIVLSRISNLLHLNKKIYARKCIVKIIDKKNSKSFLNENHIQGDCVDNFRCGLFLDDVLVSVMTFSKKRKVLGNKNSSDNHYELVRYCNKLHTNVIGGFSKLLKFFNKTQKPSKVETYADIRWSGFNHKETVYYKNGFTFLHTTKPNYWYLNFSTNSQRLHRYNFRKDVLVKEGFDKNKTESQIMFERGFDRIWDCGSMKFELKLN
jgi:hypothetical protein